MHQKRLGPDWLGRSSTEKDIRVLWHVEHEAAVHPCSYNTEIQERKRCNDVPLKAVTISIQCEVTQLLK